MKAKKIIIAILCVAFAALVGFGIYLMVTQTNKPKNPAEDTVAPGLYVDDVLVENPDVMTINGEKVDFAVYRYFYLTLYTNAIASDPAFFESEENVAEFNGVIDNYVKSYYISNQICADKGFKLTAEENKVIDDSLAQIKTGFPTDEEYQAALAAANLTEDLFLELEKSNALQAYLIKDIIGEDVQAQILRAKHILIKYAKPTEGDTSSSEATGITKEAALKLANEIAQKAKDGEDFDTLIKEYGEDPGMASNPDGYYFIDGQMVEPFEKGTKALEFDQTSEPVESDFGYHIILRLEPDQADMTAAMIAEISSNSQAMGEKYSAYIDAEMKKAKVELGKNFDKIKPGSIK